MTGKELRCCPTCGYDLFAVYKKDDGEKMVECMLCKRKTGWSLDPWAEWDEGAKE